MATAKAKGTRTAIASPTPDVIRAEYRTGGVSLRAVVTETGLRASSLISIGSRSSWFSAQRYSIATFSPSE
jgi:hypothetical protein